ncbi:MAG: lysophospholipid acyltransferase family protein, partial [Stackebrandtia sp.]
GSAVIFYPEGTTSKQPGHWPMRGRTGIARLAMETGAPVIPMTVWGPHRLFNPVTKKLRLRPRAPVTVVAGEPVDLSAFDGAEPDAETLEAMTETILLRIRDQLAEIRGEEPPPLYDLKAAKAAEKAAREDDAA